MQLGPPITMSDKARAALGLAPSFFPPGSHSPALTPAAPAPAHTCNTSEDTHLQHLQHLKDWVNKALLTFGGECLEVPSAYAPHARHMRSHASTYVDTHTATHAAGWLEASLGDLLPHAPRMQPTHALTYAGEWLEASRELLHNLLVGCTQAVCWSLHCCYHPQVSIYVYACVCMYVCIYSSLLLPHAGIYICVCMYMYVYTLHCCQVVASLLLPHAGIYICVCMCMYVCMYSSLLLPHAGIYIYVVV